MSAAHLLHGIDVPRYVRDLAIEIVRTNNATASGIKTEGCFVVIGERRSAELENEAVASMVALLLRVVVIDERARHHAQRGAAR